AKALSESQLPQPGQPVTGPPPPRAWADKDPAAAARLSAARAAVTALAEQLAMPQENLITPDTVRRVCWEPPAAVDAGSVAAALAGHGARPWQVEQVTPVLVTALTSAADPR
ncbi:ribonuclease D, partial [Streptomyces sp. SID5789]|nr:ribonuclease D [Streptomyces sp. SID5789]